MSNKAEQRRAKRARAKARKKEKKSELLISEDARKKHVQKMGQEIITAKFVAGKGKSRHQGKLEDDIFKYITSEKAFRDVSATWRRFSEFVAKHSDGTDLNSLEDILKYVDLYIMDLMIRGRKADTLTTYKANLGKVFGVSTTYFIETPKRERRNKTRSRLEVKVDHKISKEKNDFFDILGSATGLRKRELERLRGTDLIAKKAKNGLYYVNITRGTKGGRTRVSPIMAKSEEELEKILAMFKAAGPGVVCSGKYGTHRIPKNLDEHSRRAEYAKRVYKEAYDLDGTTIYLYSPLMIVYEKIRASCQQLEEYPLTTNKTRARDLYDIFKTLTNINQVELRSEVLNEDNFYILENIFRVKEVPLELMTKLDTKKDDLAADYERKVLPQISNQDREEFEYIFDYNQRLFNEIFEKYQKYNESR